MNRFDGEKKNKKLAYFFFQRGSFFFVCTAGLKSAKEHRSNQFFNLNRMKIVWSISIYNKKLNRLEWASDLTRFATIWPLKMNELMWNGCKNEKRKIHKFYIFNAYESGSGFHLKKNIANKFIEFFISHFFYFISKIQCRWCEVLASILCLFFFLGYVFKARHEKWLFLNFMSENEEQKLILLHFLTRLILMSNRQELEKIYSTLTVKNM